MYTRYFRAIQDILTRKIERNVYVNEEKSVSDIEILIILKQFFCFPIMNFITLQTLDVAATFTPLTKK